MKKSNKPTQDNYLHGGAIASTLDDILKTLDKPSFSHCEVTRVVIIWDCETEGGNQVTLSYTGTPINLIQDTSFRIEALTMDIAIEAKAELLIKLEELHK